MITEVPELCLRAYGLFFSKYGVEKPFRQSVLDWIVSQSMKKKIFSILLTAGWLEKRDKYTYVCKKPEVIMNGMLEFNIPACIREAKKKYVFTRGSAIEIWSDYCYIQRSREKSPYFIKIEEKDIMYWKHFFSKHSIYYYFEKGGTIGEYMVIVPVKKIEGVEKEGLWVEPLHETMEYARKNEMYEYAYSYMKKKYGEKV